MGNCGRIVFYNIIYFFTKNQKQNNRLCVTCYVISMVFTLIDHSSRPINVRGVALSYCKAAIQLRGKSVECSLRVTNAILKLINPLFTTLNYLFSQTEKKPKIRKLQPLAKVVETLYLILARLAFLLWSCACGASTTPYQSCQQYKTMLKTWRNNFNYNLWTAKIRPLLVYESPVWGGLPKYLAEELQSTQGPEEMCLSLEHQNPSKTSEKWVILIALQFRHTFYRPQTKRLRARKIDLHYKIRNKVRSLSAKYRPHR